MPVSIPGCINGGGPHSRIQLPVVPVLERELQCGPELLAALNCWRARCGEIITVCDPQQEEYRARITALSAETVTLLPFSRIRATESPVRIQLLQALPEKERFELILQKATEIGVSRIVPLISQRSISLQQRDAGQKKSHRWPDVLLRAARQCRRAKLPELFPVTAWEPALALAAQADLALLCYEGAGTAPLAEILQGFTGCSIALIVGPEGGFCDAEVEQARCCGVVPIDLGPRILRTETAALMVAGIVQYTLGDLGRKPVSREK